MEKLRAQLVKNVGFSPKKYTEWREEKKKK